MLKTTIIKACLPRKLVFFERWDSSPSGRVKDFKWRLLAIKNEDEENDDARLEFQSFKRRGRKERWWGEQWTESSSHYCSCDDHKPAEQDYLQDKAAADLRAMTLLNSRVHSCSITVNLQSIGWPTTHEWNLAAFTDASILEKKKIFPPL